MSNFGPFRFTLGFVTLTVLAAFAAPRPAVAGSVTVTLNGSNQLTVLEGNSITIDFTITNGSSTSISTGGYQSFPIAFIQAAPPSGDMTDANAFLDAGGLISFSCVGLNTSSTSLSPGSSCDESVTVNTLSGSGEADADSGFILLQIQVSYLNCTDPTCATVFEPPITSSSGPFAITVIDQPSNPTPEPSSLLLLGTGLLGLGPFIRRPFVS